MNLTLNFGLNGSKKQVTWWQPHDNFPKLIQYNGKKWQWVMYNAISNGDYELTFSELSPSHSRYNDSMAVFEDMFRYTGQEGCECGAVYTSFKWDHMRYCKLWTKW